MKYRAWNNKRKKFIENDVDIKDRKNYCLGEYALTPNGKLCFYEEEEGGMAVFEIENVEINFCTGLKDKNGKEIYEGDILKICENGFEDSEDDKDVYEVKYFAELSGYPAFDLSPHWDSESNGLSEVTESGEFLCEVIGNIYENENLLKELVS